MLLINSILYDIMVVVLLKPSTTYRHGPRCIFAVSNKKIPNAYCFEIKEAMYSTWQKASLNKQAEEAIIAISM